jgi:hypothetical protein
MLTSPHPPGELALVDAGCGRTRSGGDGSALGGEQRGHGDLGGCGGGQYRGQPGDRS